MLSVDLRCSNGNLAIIRCLFLILLISLVFLTLPILLITKTLDFGLLFASMV